jgi:two-component system LytT family response regulator
MKVIILEDEHAARINLISILKKINKDIDIIAVLDSVRSSIDWLSNNDHPDLGFFDIQLSDDAVFNLFSKVDISFPVIFTTAYNEYAIKAFKVNSIDYILKPLNDKAIAFALKKYESLHKSNNFSENNIKNLISQVSRQSRNQYNKSLLVHSKHKLIPVRMGDIALCYIDHGVTYIMTKNKKTYCIEKTLDKIENCLDPNEFKRASRQLIVCRDSIKEIEYYFNGRYLLKTNPPAPFEITISKGKSSEFMRWIGV